MKISLLKAKAILMHRISAIQLIYITRGDKISAKSIEQVPFLNNDRHEKFSQSKAVENLTNETRMIP